MRSVTFRGQIPAPGEPDTPPPPPPTAWPEAPAPGEPDTPPPGVPDPDEDV
jgi:hypothetical protein